MKSSVFKRCLALFIAVVMLTCNLPFVSFAADGDEEDIKDGITISSDVIWNGVEEDPDVKFTYSVEINGKPYNGSAEGSDGVAYEIKDGQLVLPWNVKATITDLENGATYSIKRLAYDNEKYALIGETNAEIGDMSATDYYVSVNGGEREKIDAETFNAATDNGNNLTVTEYTDAEGNAYSADEIAEITGFDVVRSDGASTSYSFRENTYKYVEASIEEYNVTYAVDKKFSQSGSFVKTYTYSASVNAVADGLAIDADLTASAEGKMAASKDAAKSLFVSDLKTGIGRIAYRIMTEGVKEQLGKSAVFADDISALISSGDINDSAQTFTYKTTLSTFTEVAETVYEYSTESVSVAKNLVFDATMSVAPTGSFEVDFALYDGTPSGSTEVGFEICDANGNVLQEGVDYNLEVKDSTFNAVVVSIGFTKYIYTGLKAGSYTVQQVKGAAGYIVDTNKYEFEVARSNGAVTGDHFAKSDLGGSYATLTNNTYSFIKTFKIFKNNSFSIEFTKVDQNKEIVPGATFILIERNELLNMLWTLIKNGYNSIGDFDFQSIIDAISGSDFSNLDIGTILGLILTVITNVPSGVLADLTIPAILTEKSGEDGIVSFSNSSNILNTVGNLVNSGVTGEQLAEALKGLGGIIPDEYLPLLEVIATLGDSINIHTGMLSEAYIMIESAAPKGYERSSLVYTFVVQDDGTAYVSVGLLLPVVTDALNSQFGIDLKELLVSEEEFEKVKDTLGGAFDSFEDYSSSVIDNVADFLSGILGEESGSVNTIKEIKNTMHKYMEAGNDLADSIGQTVKDFNSTLTDQVTVDWKYANTRIFVDVDLHIVGCNDSYLNILEASVSGSDTRYSLVDTANHVVVNVPFGEYSLDEFTVPEEYQLIEDSVVDLITIDNKNGDYAFVAQYHLPGEPVTTVEEATCEEEGAEITRVYCELSGEVLEETIVPIEAKGHSFGDWEEVEASTCTGAGYEQRTCKDCGKIETQGIDAEGHDWNADYTIDKEASCTEEGSRSIRCSKCNAIQKSEVIKKLPHTEATKAAKAATCTETGLTEGKYCTVCNTVTVAQQVIAALGHKEVIDKAEAPGCTSTGLSEGKHCSSCGVVLVEQKVVPATGHKAVSDPLIPATCETPGLTEGTHCEYCRKTLVERDEIPATGHYPVIDHKQDPTCTQMGLTAGAHCYLCNKTLTAQEDIPAKGHSFGPWESVEASTCTDEGLQKHTCTVCGFSEMNNTSAAGHKWESDYTVDKAPTCTADGSESIHCANCSATKDSRTIHTSGHLGEVFLPGYAPTCDTAGLTFGYYCEACDEVLLSQYTIDPLGHSWGLAWPVEESTCTEAGYAIKECQRINDDDSEKPGLCGAVEIVELPLAPHSLVFVEGVEASCTASGQKDHYACTECGGLFEDANGENPITDDDLLDPEKGHSLGEYVYNNDATCTKDGTETAKCTKCSFTTTRTAEESHKNAAHQLSHIKATPSSCTTDGTIEHYSCTACGKLFLDSEGTQATTRDKLVDKTSGHDIRVFEGIEADCHNIGYRSCYYCNVCFKLFIDEAGEEEITASLLVIPKSTHSPAEAVEENIVEATCIKKGSYDSVVYCRLCGDELSRETKAVDKTDHTPLEAVKENEVPATCTAEGAYDEVIYCEVCGEEISREAKTEDKLEHTPAEAVKENEVPATCAEEGSYELVVYCEVCGEEISREPQTEDKLAHTPGEPVIENEVDATCTEEGAYDEVIYCEVCEEEISRETKTVDALGHDWVDDPQVDPTPTEPGQESGRHCSRCGVSEGHEPVPPTGEVDLEILEAGTDQTYLIGSENGAVIYCTGPLDKFVMVLIDGEEVDKNCYTLEEGSTILIFTSEYLDTLTPGDYNVTLVYTYAEVSTVLTVLEETVDEPTTDEPTTDEPTTEEPTTEEPTTEEPTTEEPTTEEPTTQAPETTKPEGNKKPTSPATGSVRYLAMASVAVMFAAGFAVVSKKRKEDEE